MKNRNETVIERSWLPLYNHCCCRRRRCYSIQYPYHFSIIILIFLLLAGMYESFLFSLRSLHRVGSRRSKHDFSLPFFRLPTNKNMVATSIKMSTIARRKTSGYIITTTTSPTIRLFGSKRGIPGNPPGTVAIYNDQKSLTEIDENAIRNTIKRILKLLLYDTYDITLLLVDDEEMRETNFESRGVNSPTDILSFPFHFPTEKSGLLEEPEFDIPDYYTLGDMVVCVPYVIRRCQEDLQLLHDDDDDDDDDSDIGFDNDRGVSGAMADVNDPEKRIRMLLVHGILHLVGYDHIDDADYKQMVEREEEILNQLGDI
mmetsp:Transcript_26103/g.29328  ORF Transcript_26103/g.29328 Transcript_26103/m.29328 type:complete len:315 (-) Transcript_26103:31-975(-)